MTKGHPMTDDTRLPAVYLAPEPATVEDAVDAIVRIDALRDLLGDRRDRVRAWLHDRAIERAETDGAAPTWRTAAGQALLTQPAPKVTISDPTAFAGWAVDAGVLPADEVAERPTAVVDGEILAEFAAAYDRGDDPAALAAGLRDALTVTTDTWLPSDAVDRLLDGDHDVPVDLAVRAEGEGAAVDTRTGEAIPGVAVHAPQPARVQVRPDPKRRKAARRELDALVGASDA